MLAQQGRSRVDQSHLMFAGVYGCTAACFAALGVFVSPYWFVGAGMFFVGFLIFLLLALFSD